LKKGKVLIVDDEIKILHLVEMYLTKNEYKVTAVNNGKAALKEIEREKFDIVVLDIMMPDMTGYQVCKKIRRHNNIPVIFLSSLQESDLIVKGLEYGGDDYITKPFDPNVLVAKVNAVLRRTKKDSVVLGSRLVEPLTGQERQILYWIDKGYTNKEIAEKFNLTIGTVKVYNHTIFQKLHVKNRTQAIVKAKELNII